MKSHWLHKAGAALLILVLVLGGCQKPAGESESLRSAAHRVIKITAEDLKGKRIGVMTGSPQDKTVEAAVENPELYYFENNPDEALALANGKIDSFICVDAIFRYMQPEHPELAESTFIYDTYHAGAIFPKSKQGEKLQNEMNAYLDEITDSGEMKSLQNYWFSEGEKEPVELPKTGENGILLGAVTSSIPPYSYLIDGKRGGYDIAILKGFCERYGYGINLEEANYAGMVTGTAAEKYDICISVIAWTKERAENVLFSQEYLEYNMIAVVRADTATKDASVLSAPLTILNGKKAGVMTGTPQDEIVLSNVDDAELLYYNNYADCALALYEGKIDFYVNNTIQFPFVAAEYPGFSYISRTMTRFDNGAVFPKNKAGEALCRRFNSFLAKAKEDGTLEELNEYWLKPGDWKNPDIPKEGKNGTLKMVTCTTMKPFSFLLNNEYAGFDIALAAEFCRQNGYALEIDNADFAGVLGGISTGRYDLAAGQIAWTKERAENVLYSDLYVSQLIVPYVRTADFSEASDRNTESPTFFEKIATSFRRTFIDENRWQIILNGLAATLIISVFGFLLANVLGALFCFLSLSKRKAFRIAADVYSRIMQGTPIVAVLMILYYIVFGNTDLSGIIIAVIGFGITSGAYVAQVFSGGISSISSGQREAALALGMTKRRAFTGIVLPQAIRRMLPGYFSQFISLVKGTAIVGYIAVIDLTKAGDIIRSTTFEVFFPLLTTAVIYFLISFLLLSVMKRIEKYLAPKRRSSKGKGA